MNKLPLFIIVAFLTFFNLSSLEAKYSYYSSNSATHNSYSHSPSFQNIPKQLKTTVTKLLELPEARELLAQVNQEGPVSVVMQNDPSGQFDAFWDGNQRRILVNPHRHQTEGSWICSILFELHNASTNQYMRVLFESAKSNRISKDEWVKQMEKMEHTNALKTCALLDKGISQGIYPANSHWNIFYTFDDHYKLQQVTGHSDWLVNKYESIAPHNKFQEYRGTVPGLKLMSAEDKEDLLNYLSVKNQLESPVNYNVVTGKNWLKKEFARLDKCSSGKSRVGCKRTKEKIHLMSIAFKGNSEYETLSHGKG